MAWYILNGGLLVLTGYVIVGAMEAIRRSRIQELEYLREEEERNAQSKEV